MSSSRKTVVSPNFDVVCAAYANKAIWEETSLLAMFACVCERSGWCEYSYSITPIKKVASFVNNPAGVKKSQLFKLSPLPYEDTVICSLRPAFALGLNNSWARVPYEP